MAYIEWYTREYRCSNGVCEKTKYPVRTDGDKSACSGREYQRRIRQAEKNATEAKNEAARTANENFRAERDYLLTATISAEGMEELVMKAGTDDPDELLLALRRELANWIRRAKRKLPEGAELKYMAFPADQDGKKLTPTLPHIHVIVNAEGMEAMRDTWKLGFVFGDGKQIFSAHHGDLTDLVEYLMNQSRTVGTEKRYVPSRNLRKPEATRPRLAKNPDARLRVPNGAQLIYASEQRAGRPQKIRYYRPEKDSERDRIPDEEERLE